MPSYIHQFVSAQAHSTPHAPALLTRERTLEYAALDLSSRAVAAGLQRLRLEPHERVAVFLPKKVETVCALFGISRAGGCFVPVNPLLKPRQVGHILADCAVRVLITSVDRLQGLASELRDLKALEHVVLVDDPADPIDGLPDRLQIHSWREFAWGEPTGPGPRTESDIAAILYTSGSTGQPKGVVLSHRNLVAGAESVAEYTTMTANDRLLAVLPLSFDAGLSQLTTAFSSGASVVLLDYLLPRDVIQATSRHAVTGIAAVPPLWNQLARQQWPSGATERLRFVTSTGGAMPIETTQALQRALPKTAIFLMYGLTEAFRSTYLPPDQLSARPDSIGKAIPNAQVLVVDDSGEECPPGEPGELVHRGPLVSMGYWNNPEATAERFRPAPTRLPETPLPELAVWSGDKVVADEDGFLYFIGREDQLIKTSGYRVSPSEIEGIAMQAPYVADAVALGAPHPDLGQAIVAVVTLATRSNYSVSNAAEELLALYRRDLPGFMLPKRIIIIDAMPLNQNGKVDRALLANRYQKIFTDDQH